MRLTPNIAVAVAAVVALGCTPHQPFDDKSVPPVAHLDPARLHPDPPDAAAPALVEDGPHDPVAAAAAAIAAGLHAEGLEVVDVTANLIDIDATGATVAVAAVHGTGIGHPDQSTYQIDLERGRDGWTVRQLVATS